MEVYERFCKTALSPSGLSDVDLTLNPYLGCEHGCKYCYAPFILHRDPEEWSKRIGVKINIVQILLRELKSGKAEGKAEGKTVSISTVTDGYQPIEGRYMLTRKCLECLLRFNIGLSIQTKSSLVLRDLEILKKFTSKEVGFTLTTLNEKHRKIYEPNSSPSMDRLKAIKVLKANGIKTFVFVGPVMPIFTFDKEFFKRIKEVEPDYVIVDRLRIKRGMEANIKEIYRDFNYGPGELKQLENRAREECERVGLNVLPEISIYKKLSFDTKNGKKWSTFKIGNNK